MQKLRCPRCGAINLEGFVTYPQCAGCGNTLPQPSQGREPVWKRPMGPLLGVSFLAVALTAALGAAGYFQSENNSQGQAILHGNASREGRVGDIIFVALMVDAVTESREQRRQPLNDVRLHLPLKMFKALRFVSIEPKPDTMTLVGNGRYFH